MGLGALPMPKILLASFKLTSIYFKKVLKYTTNFTIDYYKKNYPQEHREVSPSISLEIEYTQQNI